MLNARLNAGLSARVSTRALIIFCPSDRSFAHDGTRPQVTVESRRSAWSVFAPDSGSRVNRSKTA